MDVSSLEDTGVSLGKGAYGEVFKMKLDGQDVAVKKVHRELLNAPGSELTLNNFEEECKRLGSIHHPNIVSFLGVYYERNSDVPMLVMEYVPISLRQYVEGNCLPEDRRTSILLDIARGLNYMHGLNPPLIHRDLTSNNVLLTVHFTAKIADFGVSKLLNHKAIQTMTNVPGTESHMPPEAKRKGEQAYVQFPVKAKKLDVFSFGNVMINLLTGEFPVADDFDVDNSGRRKTEVQRRMRLLDKIEESDEKDLIVCCLNNNPDHRPVTQRLVDFFEGTSDEYDDATTDVFMDHEKQQWSSEKS